MIENGMVMPIYKFIGAESTHGYKVKGSRVAEIF